MELFWDHMPAFVPFSSFKTVGQCDPGTYMFLKGLLGGVLNTFDAEEALPCELVLHLWNPIFNNGSGVEDKCLRKSSGVQYSSTNQLLMHHFVYRDWRMM